MITHIVLLQPKPETTAEELEAALEQVRALKGKFPGLLAVQAGANQHSAHQGYIYGFVMQFEDEEHFRAYSPHPAHRAANPEPRQFCTTLLNFDIPQK